MSDTIRLKLDSSLIQPQPASFFRYDLCELSKEMGPLGKSMHRADFNASRLRLGRNRGHMLLCWFCSTVETSPAATRTEFLLPKTRLIDSELSSRLMFAPLEVVRLA